MTDLFGNPIEDAKPVFFTKQPQKAALDPVSLPLQPLPALPPPNTPIRRIASVIREGNTTTIWHHD
jgi:hypothetical protein